MTYTTDAQLDFAVEIYISKISDELRRVYLRRK